MPHYESSQDDLEKLKNFKQGLNKYASLRDGDQVEWEFNPKTVAEVTNNFGQEKVQFDVYDPVIDHEFIWQTSYSAGREVMKLMEQGKYFLRIKRTGSGTKDTKYTVEEITG
jgi:hypothetical protein